MLIFIAIAAFTATLIGGLFAIYLKDNRHLVLGFSAGAVIGVAFFDLLPEALDLAGKEFSTANVTAFVALGFVLYMLLDRFVGFHSHSDDHLEHHNDHDEHKHTEVISSGGLGAGSLSFHSFLDGLGIGLAFQVSTTVGIIITTAVLVHDFSDGINTVNLILRNNGSIKKAFRWLLLDATAPILGIIATLFFTLNQSTLGLILAIFCGFFLYIGASDLLPESNHNHPTFFTTMMTVLGFAVMFTAIRLAGV
jgi:zinc transporter ZupT